MKYWLMKSEPESYAWSEFVSDKKTGWTGVRNFQARNNMRAMKKGDLAFFYHSNDGREIVGVMEVVKEYHPDPTDKTGKFGMVAVAPLKAFKTPVTLAAIKAHPRLRDMALLRQSRLSVAPVTPAAWEILCGMGGV
ncbi:MAG: EVE domain-containing protein [Alphaproteobacteria bacterium]|nr:EVE domain-containing protein [Alphaproteobacteria bacterium]MDE2336482.1 EVE domain-containing protein [Alphaproteobacteria bacterium]